jgi:hypothetical protein
VSYFGTAPEVLWCRSAQIVDTFFTYYGIRRHGCQQMVGASQASPPSPHFLKIKIEETEKVGNILNINTS